MSDDMEKTEEATPKRRDDAREEGRIPRSPELAVAAALVGSAMVLKSVGPSLAAVLTDTMGGGLTAIGTAPGLDAQGAVLLLRAVGGKALVATAMACAAITGVPRRNPVAAAALSVISPVGVPGATSGGIFARSMPAASRISTDHCRVRMSSVPVGSAEAIDVDQRPVSRKVR